VVITNPTSIGIGIEEDTALLIKEGINIEVIGTGLVIVIEGFEIEATNMENFTEDRPITARNLKVHLLSSGDTYQVPQVNPPHK
jgi:cyanophycinase